MATPAWKRVFPISATKLQAAVHSTSDSSAYTVVPISLSCKTQPWLLLLDHMLQVVHASQERHKTSFHTEGSGSG
ncbi:hypothetical protein V5799_020413 [Amblyomma americanum]|uniref:Uncharacterized protein n=1 Tax=Amblyomma americanum TaxID=6943 RepID=A0AAQ4EU01_AMBAM